MTRKVSDLESIAPNLFHIGTYFSFHMLLISRSFLTLIGRSLQSFPIMEMKPAKTTFSSPGFHTVQGCRHQSQCTLKSGGPCWDSTVWTARLLGEHQSRMPLEPCWETQMASRRYAFSSTDTQQQLQDSVISNISKFLAATLHLQSHVSNPSCYSVPGENHENKSNLGPFKPSSACIAGSGTTCRQS